MGKSSYILIFISLFIWFSCQTSQKLEELPTILRLNVTDENGKPLTGAIVAVFNNDATYLEKSPVYSTEGAVKVDTTANGVSEISGLNGNDNYRISIHYKDYTSYPGLLLDLDNNGLNYNLLNKLYEGSITVGNVKLKPANGLVTFWTGTDNNSKLPFKIAFGNTITDSLTHTFSTKPSPAESGVTTLKIKNGSYRYYLTSKSGCLYSDTLTVIGGELKYVKLESCNTGRISFWTGQANNSSLPLTVIVNNNDTLGVINSVFGISPTDCFATNLLFADYVPGEYVYTAVSNSSQTIWTGKLSIAKDNCQLIEIK